MTEVDAPEEIVSAIRRQNDLFEENFAGGDASRLVQEYYVPDHLKPLASTGEGQAIVGRAGLTALFEALMGQFAKARQVSHFIRSDRDLAYEVSNSYLTPRAGGDEVEFRYIATWRRCDDKWRVEADFFAAGPLG